MNTQKNNILNFFFPTHDLSTEHYQNWIELSLSAVKHNAQQFQTWLGCDMQLAAVIKSNAYGHGMIEMATIYESVNLIKTLCVINLSEAILLRKNNIKKPIFVLSYLDTDYNVIPQHNIEVVVYDLATANKLNEAGRTHQKKINVHIKFDTGMSRLGVLPQDLDSFIQAIENLPWLKITTIFSHLAESYNKERTQQQETVFLKTLPEKYKKSISNSHGVLTIRNKENGLARIGIGLFGYLQKYSSEIQNNLKPVLSLKTKILQIKKVSVGSPVGYDGKYQAQRDMTIAIIAAGYYEGIDDRLSNVGKVIINGQFAPIVGRVCMNLTIIDITDISYCTTGQTVTLLGKEGDISISAYDWSLITTSSVYNHLTRLSAVTPRIIVS